MLQTRKRISSVHSRASRQEFLSANLVLRDESQNIQEYSNREVNRKITTVKTGMAFFLHSYTSEYILYFMMNQADCQQNTFTVVYELLKRDASNHFLT